MKRKVYRKAGTRHLKILMQEGSFNINNVPIHSTYMTLRINFAEEILLGLLKFFIERCLALGCGNGKTEGIMHSQIVLRYVLLN